MKLPDLQDHVIGSYTAIRMGVAIIGAVLPVVLLLGAVWSPDVAFAPSMSAYYHGPMRDVFVGCLLAVAAVLFLYRGYTHLENLALDVGGVSLAGVAWVPTCETDCQGFSLHGSLAILFFLSIAYVCLFRASDTVALIEEQGREGSAKRAARYRMLYRWFGIGLIASPVAAWVLSVMRPGYLIFIAEALGVLVFGAYWMTKSREIRETHADELAAMGLLESPSSRPLLASLAQPTPVQLRSMVDATTVSGADGRS